MDPDMGKACSLLGSVLHQIRGGVRYWASSSTEIEVLAEVFAFILHFLNVQGNQFGKMLRDGDLSHGLLVLRRCDKILSLDFVLHAYGLGDIQIRLFPVMEVIDLKGVGLSSSEPCIEKKADDEDNEQDAEFFQQFLRARYATGLRKTEKGAKDEDYEKIGSEFHQWVFEHRAGMGLHESKDVVHFILNTLPFYTGIYEKLVSYEAHLTPGFEDLYYNRTCKGISYQDMLIKASIQEGDSGEEIEKKIKLVSFFIDRYTMERLFEYKKANWNTVKSFVFNLMVEMRDMDSKELAIRLIQASQQAERSVYISFKSVAKYRLYTMNKWFVHFALARFTAYFDGLLGYGSTFLSYMNQDKKAGKTYDIEHIVANNYDLYGANYQSQEEFDEYRNRLGGLILLTFDKNRSLQDEPASDKIEKSYIQDNSIARSLNPHFYENNPAFNKLSDKFGIHSYNSMEKEGIEERSKVYADMAEAIWSLGKFKEIVGNWTQESDHRLLLPNQRDEI